MIKDCEEHRFIVQSILVWKCLYVAQCHIQWKCSMKSKTNKFTSYFQCQIISVSIHSIGSHIYFIKSNSFYQFSFLLCSRESTLNFPSLSSYITFESNLKYYFLLKLYSPNFLIYTIPQNLKLKIKTNKPREQQQNPIRQKIPN